MGACAAYPGWQNSGSVQQPRPVEQNPRPSPPKTNNASTTPVKVDVSSSASASSPSTASGGPGPWEVMYQSHQALFHLLDQTAIMTSSLKRDKYDEIRLQCKVLFELLKLHARVEDAVFFPAVDRKFPGMSTRYGDDHKRSAEGRPKLLEALDKAKEDDVSFEAGMAAMRKFCEGNKTHQLGEEEVINPNLSSFSLEEQKQIVKAMAQLDPESWNTTYCLGIFARVDDEKRMRFLKGLQQSISPAQFATIIQNIQNMIQHESDKLIVPVNNQSTFLRASF